MGLAGSAQTPPTHGYRYDRSMVVRALLICLLLAGSSATAVPIWGEPLVESIDDQDSIPDDNVSALLEDAEGFLWIGTPNGLLRYDGYRFLRFVHDPAQPGSLCGSFIRALALDADNRLWVGSNAEGVCVFDARRQRFDRLHDAEGRPLMLDQAAVRALAVTADGSVWIGTLGGLARWHPASRQLQLFPGAAGPAGTRDRRIFALTVDGADRLWVGSWAGVEFFRPSEGVFEAVPLADAVGASQEPSVRAIVPAADGALWFGTLDAAIVRRSADGRRIERVQVIGDDGMPQPSRLMLLTGVQTTGAELWLAGLGGVLNCSEASAVCRQPLLYDPTVPIGLASQDIRALLQDRAGLIWLGGYSSGLQRINAGNRALRMLRYRPLDRHALSDASISAVHVGGDGLLYLGSRGRGIDVVDPAIGVVDRIRPDPAAGNALVNGVVTALVRNAAGQLWAGTDYGVSRIDYPAHRGRHLLREDGLPSNTIRRLFLDGEQRLWIGTNLGLARLDHAEGRPQILLEDSGRPLEADVNAMLSAADGSLWVGTIRGLFVMASGRDRLQRVDTLATEGAGLGSPSILGLLFDRDQRLWLDTPAGLYRLREWDGQQAAFDDVSSDLGIAGQPFGANLLQDAQGRIWTHRFVYDPSRARVDELLRTDGADLGTGWFRAYDRDSAGRFYFGGSKGLLRIEPELFQPWRYAPPTVITGLSVDGHAEALPAPGAPLRLDSGARRVSVEFATLDYSAPQRLRYRYRLLGLDRDWHDTDPGRRLASYSNLWPGDYRLQIQGSNRAGEWSPHELTLPITVAPEYWQTAAFQFAIGLLTLASGWAAARLYSRRLRHRSQQLQRLVDERTAELLQAKNRAERVADDLRVAQQQLVEQEKVAALGRLVAGVAHEINTPLGIAVTASSMIGSQIQQLQKDIAEGKLTRSALQQFCQTASEAGSITETALAKTAQLVQTFKSVAVGGEHEPRVRFDLGDFLQNLCRSLETSWRAVGVHYHLHCPPGLRLDSYPSTLGQVLMTLAGNALCHAFEGREGGTLTIAVASIDDDGVQLEFADDGRGIDASDLPHLFEPFFTTRRGRGGTGLGLNIAHNQVTVRLGGSISVDSTPGQGCRFLLRLPRQAPTATASL